MVGEAEVEGVGEGGEGGEVRVEEGVGGLGATGVEQGRA